MFFAVKECTVPKPFGFFGIRTLLLVVTLSRISPLAATVKEETIIWLGLIPFPPSLLEEHIYSINAVKVCVLPLPAPAAITTFPELTSIASCSSFNSYLAPTAVL